jgi:hypothetical protein
MLSAVPCRISVGTVIAAMSPEVGRPGERSGGDGGVPGLVGYLHSRRLASAMIAEHLVEVVEVAEESRERIPVLSATAPPCRRRTPGRPRRRGCRR